MNIPDISRKYVQSFCKTISKHDPILVPLRPKPHKDLNNCVNIVKEHALMNGGKQHLGWAIWEWPKVFIEAEFHAVWESPDGEFIDLTPKSRAFDDIVFLPDTKIKYRGRQIDNIRKSLVTNKDVKRYFYLFEQKFIEMNKGHLADYHGPIPITKRIGQLHKEMMDLELKLIKKYGRH